ncbi:MAG: macro domain-containing protein [Clostridia bacterium]|nr:macro domain-containing protein [Clostridia bacterium]
MPFTIVRQDITRMPVDAIVNAANTGLQMGGGVCGAIFRAAGPANLQAACDQLAPIRTGEAVVTPGFQLPAKYVIHTAGPVYHGGQHGEEAQLSACYRNSLLRAVERQCESIAFPLISSGIYGYPKDQALQVATHEILTFLQTHDLEVYLAIFDHDAFKASQKLLGAVASYIDEHYVETHTDQYRARQLLEVEQESLNEPSPLHIDTKKRAAAVSDTSTAPSLEDLVGNLDEPFSTTLLRLIDIKGKSDVEVYKKANLDRKLFSKIRSSQDYLPSKRTAIALAIGLELSLSETDDLLERAGYSLSPSQKFDVIVEYFIVNGQYDIFTINEILFQHDQPLLGS